MDIYVYMCICVFLSEAMNSFWRYLDFKYVTTLLLVIAILILLLLSDIIMNEKVYVIRRYLCYDTKKSVSNIVKFCHDCVLPSNNFSSAMYVYESFTMASW